jgi:hypothetical protein
MLGDMSPFDSVSMTVADAIFLDVALREKLRIKNELQYIMLDVRFYLAQMAQLTPEGQKFIPSRVHAMEKALEGEG